MLVQIPRWVDRVRRSSGGKGPAESAVQDDLQPSIQVDDLTQSPYKFLSRDWLVQGNFNIIAAAAQFATVTLSIANNPNILVWIRRLVVSSDINCLIALGRDTGLTGATQNLVSRDTRADLSFAFLQPGVMSLSQSSQVGTIPAGQRFGDTRILANAHNDIPLDLVYHGRTGADFSVGAITAQAFLRGWIEAEVLAREPSEQ